MLNTLLALVRQADEVRSGVTSLLYLRAYPAVLLLAAYGLGLTHSGRWQALHRLFSHPITRSDREEGRIVDKLFLWCWEGADQNIWHRLPNLERRHTPLSDHLCALMDRWRTSFVAVVADFEELYDTWEILGSLAYCDTLTIDELQDESRRTWIPLGRNGWRHASRRRILGRVQGGDMFGELGRCGFRRWERRKTVCCGTEIRGFRRGVSAVVRG